MNTTAKYFRDDDKIILEKRIDCNSHEIFKTYKFEVSTTHNSSNYKFLKIWKHYWDNIEGEWKHSKQGIIIPIKDAKKLIKELNEYFTKK